MLLDSISELLDLIPRWVWFIIFLIYVNYWVKSIAKKVFEDEYPYGIDEEFECRLDDLEEKVEKLEKKKRTTGKRK